MQKLNKILVVALTIIFICTGIVYAEENYFDKVQQGGIDYTLGETLVDLITKVQKGEITGKEALSDYTLSSDKIEETISGLSKLVLISPPNEDVKSLKDAPEDGIVHLREGHTWKEMHQKVIQTITYYVVVQIMTRRALIDLDLQQLKSAKNLIELGDKAQEKYIND